MRFETAARRRRQLSMTSLIDVIFLLLLFFMLTSTFSRFADVELGAGGGAGPVATDVSPAFVKLSDARISLNGKTVLAEDLAAELSRRQAENGLNALILSVDDTASSQQLVDLLLIARKLPGLSLQIIQ